ncbi:hypothetical protein GF324_00275 [bacterium]|nr:hypothetical protein [bacterium]
MGLFNRTKPADPKASDMLMVESTHPDGFEPKKGSIEVQNTAYRTLLEAFSINEETVGLAAQAFELRQQAFEGWARDRAAAWKGRTDVAEVFRDAGGEEAVVRNVTAYVRSLFGGKISDTTFEKRERLSVFLQTHEFDAALVGAAAAEFQSFLRADDQRRKTVPAAAIEAAGRLCLFDTALVARKMQQQVKGTEEEHRAELERRDGNIEMLDGAIHEATRVGDLTSRSDLSGFPEELRGTAEALNSFLDSILIPLREATDVLERVKNRDLTARITSSFVGDYTMLPEALNPALDHLNEALSIVREVVFDVEEGAQRVSDTSQSLSSGATEQASSLEEIHSMVEGVTSQTRQNEESAREADKLIHDARKQADVASDSMQNMLTSMSELEGNAGEISKVIKMIEEIAFQTNLLALNAAVEAARAGIHGKSFAVVAEEVRNLSGRSAQAAKQTAELIETAIQSVEKSTNIANQTGAALTSIVDSVVKVTHRIEEIVSASREQTSGIEQVNAALQQIESVIQTNATNAEDGATVAARLNEDAIRLKEIVDSFVIDGGTYRSVGPRGIEQREWKQLGG